MMMFVQHGCALCEPASQPIDCSLKFFPRIKEPTLFSPPSIARLISTLNFSIHTFGTLNLILTSFLILNILFLHPI